MTSQHKHGAKGNLAAAGDVDARIAKVETAVAALAASHAALAELFAAHVAVPAPQPPEPTGPVFYMAPGGTGDGSQLRPWGSIQSFIDTNPVAGSTLYLRGGAYPHTAGGRTGRDTYGSLIGTAEKPITIRNAPGEVVSFPDVPAQTVCFWPNEQSDRVGASHVVLEEIDFPGVRVTDEAAIVIGGAEPTKYLVNNITIRGLSGSLWSGSKSVDHIIGLIRGCEDVAILNCAFMGTVGQGDAVVIYDKPAALRTIVRGCEFSGFPRLALQVWDYAGASAVASIVVEGCVFRRNGTALDLRYHGPASVKDCSFDVPAGTRAIYDPHHAARTTTSGNTYAA